MKKKIGEIERERDVFLGKFRYNLILFLFLTF